MLGRKPVGFFLNCCTTTIFQDKSIFYHLSGFKLQPVRLTLSSYSVQFGSSYVSS